MNTLKELLNKVYTDLQKSDWIKEYPELSQKKEVANYLEAIALATIPDFVEKDSLDEFSKASQESYTETTFKRYITKYSEFLINVEHEFYNGLLM
jgi:hypothetical protein